MKRFGLSIESSFILFAISGVLAGFEFWRLHGQGWRVLAILVSVPALASLILVVICSMVPGVLATGRLRFPLNITLPVIHTLLIVVCTKILLTTPNGAEIPPEAMRPIELWLRWGVLASVLILEFAILTGLVATLRPPKADPAA
jgi:hypothetical protein